MFSGAAARVVGRTPGIVRQLWPAEPNQQCRTEYMCSHVGSHMHPALLNRSIHRTSHPAVQSIAPLYLLHPAGLAAWTSAQCATPQPCSCQSYATSWKQKTTGIGEAGSGTGDPPWAGDSERGARHQSMVRQHPRRRRLRGPHPRVSTQQHLQGFLLGPSSLQD